MTLEPDPGTHRPRRPAPRARRGPAPTPELRRLRVFAMDPGLTARFETAVSNEMTLLIPWERLDPGPRGEYVEVVDRDQAGHEYAPGVDLNTPEVLANDGLAPS